MRLTKDFWLSQNVIPNIQEDQVYLIFYSGLVRLVQALSYPTSHKTPYYDEYKAVLY